MLEGSFPKLMEAVSEVSRSWIPVHEAVMSRIEQRFEDGTYAESRIKLKQDLKMDVALYTYCLRELVNLEGRISDELQTLVDETEKKAYSPGELIRTASLSEMRQIIGKAREELTKHSLSSMTDIQALQLHQSLLSAVTSETLATRSALDPEIGFTCGLLRQFGRMLVAWNYPQQYERALNNSRRLGSLDESLQEVLGYSPQALGLSFARRWNMPEEIISVLSERAPINKPQPFARKAVKVEGAPVIELGKICEIAEAFAQASYPEYFPNALDQWSTAQDLVLKHFGPQGMQSILQMNQQHLECYQNLDLRLPGSVSPHNIRLRITESVYQEHLLKRNKFVQQLCEPTREAMIKIYKRLQPHAVQKDLVRELVKEILPAAGFPTGCIYLYDPDSALLSPALGVGATSYKQLAPVALFTSNGQHNVIASAYNLKAPLRAPRTLNSGATVTTIAASLGTCAPLGVLYVETSPAHDRQPLPDAMTLFRAVRQCLTDCLNLA